MIRYGGLLFVLVSCRFCRSCLHSRRRGVVSAYAVFNTPTIGPGSYHVGGKAGTTFVSIPTGYALEVRDGHDFISDAVAHGATGVILHNEEILLPNLVWAFLVDDTKHAIGELGRAWRSRFDVRAIAIAGNVGKTTTKELTAAVLQGCGRTVLKSPMNFNGEIGLAMTLFQLDPTYDRAVVEVGMFELGEIRRFCQIAQPRIGVVLNVGPTHLDRLGSMQAIAKAKLAGKKVFDGGAVPSNLTLVEPALTSPKGAVLLRFGLADGTPATGAMW